MKATRSKKLVWTVCLIWAAAGPPGRGQDRPGDATPQVLRVQTRLVLVNAVVTDRQGVRVAGLTRDDFTIFDGGKEERISFFSAETGRALGPPLAPLPFDQFSNRVGKQGGVPTSVTVILLDGLNTEFADQAYARQQLIKFLEGLQPGERVALYTLGNHLSVVQDFTSDPAPLLEAIRQYHGKIPMGPIARSDEPVMTTAQLTGPAADSLTRLQAGILNATSRVDAFYARIRAEKTMDALKSIALHLSGLPGRKSLIWVSAGFPPWVGGDPRNLMTQEYSFTAQIQRAAEALNQADIAIYPVDARGLFTDPDFSAWVRRMPSAGPGASGRGAALAAMEATLNTMQIMAEETGGREFYHTNDLQGSIRAAFDDARVSYTLGYYPSHGQWDGKYRAIRVEVKRPDARARYRRGYFAGLPAPAGNQKAKALLEEAGQDPLEATAVGVTVRVRPFEGYSAKQIELTVSIDPRDVTLEQAAGRWKGSFDLWAIQYTDQGKSKGGITKSSSLNLREESYQKIMRDGLTLWFNDKVERGAEKVLVIVRDNPSGKVGWVNVPLGPFLSRSQTR